MERPSLLILIQRYSFFEQRETMRSKVSSRMTENNIPDVKYLLQLETEIEEISTEFCFTHIGSTFLV